MMFIESNQLINIKEIISRNDISMNNMKSDLVNLKEKMSQMENALKGLEENNQYLKRIFEKQEKAGTDDQIQTLPTIQKVEEEEESTSEETETYFAKDKMEEKKLVKKPASLFILTFGAIKHLKTYKENNSIGYKCLAVKGNSCITCNKSIRVWDLTTGNTTLVLKENEERYNCVYSFQNWIVVATKSKDLKVWHFVTGELLKNFKVESEIKCISGYDNCIYAGSKKGIIYIWDFLSDKKMTLEAHQSKIYHINTDSKHIYTASKDSSIRIWSRQSGKFISQLKHSSPPNYISFHTERNLLISGNYGGIVSVWNLKDYKLLSELKSHQGPIVSVGVHNDFILSAGRDGTLKFWNYKYKLVASVKCHDDTFSNFQITNQKIVTTSKSKLIKVWMIEEEEVDS